MEIETEKSVVEIEAPASGILVNMTAVADDEIPVGQQTHLLLSPPLEYPDRLYDEGFVQTYSATVFLPELKRLRLRPEGRREALSPGRNVREPFDSFDSAQDERVSGHGDSVSKGRAPSR